MRRRWVPALTLVAVVLTACSAPAAPRDSSLPVGSAGPSAATPPDASPRSAVAPPAVSAAAPSPPPDRQAVSAGYSPFFSYGSLFVALERGYFAEQGIDLDLVSFDAAGLMIPPLSAGQLDVGMGVPGPALFNALARGLEFKLLMANSYSDGYLMVRKELVDSGRVQTWDDLRGKRVSFHVEGSSADYLLRDAFYRNGLTLQDVEVYRLGNPDIPPALANGAVDAAVAPEPVPMAVEAQGTAVRWSTLRDVVGLHIAGSLMAGPSLLSRGDGPVTRFVTAVVKGQRDYNAGNQNGKVVDPELRDILSKWTNLPSQTIALATAIEGPPNGRIDLDDLNAQQEFWLRETLQRERVDLSQIVESKYVEAAVARLR
jgi:NitT/TauT family transport system substrate-binding protein